MKIAYQGIPGSYSESCAKDNYPGCETISCKTFDECFEIASSDSNVRAIIPMISKNDSSNLEKSNKIFEYLKSKNVDAIIDDTDENISAKIKKFNLIGVPYQLIIGKKTEGELFEFKEVGEETQKIKIEDIASQINKAKSN